MQMCVKILVVAFGMICMLSLYVQSNFWQICCFTKIAEHLRTGAEDQIIKAASECNGDDDDVCAFVGTGVLKTYACQAILIICCMQSQERNRH